jgi:hypothetical protein
VCVQHCSSRGGFKNPTPAAAAAAATGTVSVLCWVLCFSQHLHGSVEALHPCVEIICVHWHSSCNGCHTPSVLLWRESNREQP